MSALGKQPIGFGERLTWRYATQDGTEKDIGRTNEFSLKNGFGGIALHSRNSAFEC
jgi:hypothetical protein